MRNREISAEECAQIRREYSFSGGFSPLEETFGVDREQLRDHLYGNCSHDLDVDPTVPPVEQRVSVDECRSFRERINEGKTIVELADQFERKRQTITRHVTGECEHSLNVPTVDKNETYIRDRISPANCTELRERFHRREDGDVQEFVTDTDFSYPAVLRHLNGQCGHDIAAPRRETEDRVDDISQELCQKMRSAWRDDPDVTFEEIADRFGQTASSVDHHIKFNCSHEYETLLVDEMGTFSEYLDDS